VNELIIAGQAYGAAAEAVYWWYSSWYHWGIDGSFLRKMGWNCWLCRYERPSIWKVYRVEHIVIFLPLTLLATSNYCYYSSWYYRR